MDQNEPDSWVLAAGKVQDFHEAKALLRAMAIANQQSRSQTNAAIAELRKQRRISYAIDIVILVVVALSLLLHLM